MSLRKTRDFKISKTARKRLLYLRQDNTGQSPKIFSLNAVWQEKQCQVSKNFFSAPM